MTQFPVFCDSVSFYGTQLPAILTQFPVFSLIDRLYLSRFILSLLNIHSTSGVGVGSDVRRMMGHGRIREVVVEGRGPSRTGPVPGRGREERRGRRRHGVMVMVV